jgi:acetoin utilization protein AcuB
MTRPLTIGDVMTHHPWVIGEDAPLRQARSLMVEHEIRHLPVVHRGRCVGVLTDRDVKRALDPALGLPPEDELFVRDACVFDVYTVPATEPLERVLRHMAAHHLGSALVLEHHRPVGILTASDACRAFADFLKSTATPAFEAHAHVEDLNGPGAPRA